MDKCKYFLLFLLGSIVFSLTNYSNKKIMSLVIIVLLTFIIWNRCLEHKFILLPVVKLDFPQIQNIISPSLVGLSSLEGYRTYNPSVFSYKNDILYTARLSNYTLCTDIRNKGPNVNKDLNWRSKTHSYTFIFNTKGDIRYINIGDNSKKQCVQGNEDARPFVYKDNIFLFSTALSKNIEGNCRNQMWLSKIKSIDLDSEKNILYPTNVLLNISFDQNLNQKNWMPFVSGDDLLCVYSVNPHIILKCNIDSGDCQKIAETFNSRLPNNIRGGSQAVYYKMPDGSDRFIAVTHKYEGIYTSQIYTFSTSHPYQIIEYADNFIIGENVSAYHYVQFVSGLAIVDDHAIITYGEEDCHARYSKIPMDTILKLLKPVSEGTKY